ncbi:phage tail length tape measure family protein [Devosia sp. 63-57]|uniref:phage tail length tape measure family protein n=1 Tax=Devosia sp. 63-57 TaxID=1895751 RepID=UPI00086DEC33|nr:phage tail length tape measure family protein [Devosia sp. 63-57]ODT50259.1 MAG: hypothetical protein ABS74_04905 [Pelagibacterium sp. SCN 63-126]ODU83016.1 MAG: hypothetical protein ABT14_16160 [Pelagibacterium sp. SCN 63-17]OJX45003.1 MAG: hypothetical protein BGO80_03905 [Devosia sp. 63-57]
MQVNVVRSVTVRGQSEGLDKVERDLNKVSAAQEKVAATGETAARVTETSTRRQVSAARDYQRVMERNDRMIALQAQMAREAAVVSRAFEQGAIDAMQHANAVGLLETKYQRLVAAEERARANANGLASANDNLARSMHRVAAANDNAVGSTANIAAQFQDIGVTAAMGMNPIMIALQQGTQLSAVLNTMQNPLRGLATAFVSIINPVSLLTIGFVALGAAAIQWFASAKGEADRAAEALEKHDKWLDDILRGYESVRQAANDAGEAAARLPKGVVALELAAGIREIAGETMVLQANMDAVHDSLSTVLADLNSPSAPSIFGVDGDQLDSIRQQVDYMLQLGLSTSNTREELDAAAEAARGLFFETGNSIISDLADNVFKLARQLMGLRERANEAERAQVALNLELQSFADIRPGVQELVDQQRRLEEQARRTAAAIDASKAAALQAARGYGEAAGAANIYAGSLQRLQALIPAVAAAQEAGNRLAAATIDYDKGRESLEAMRAAGLSRDEYVQRTEALTEAYQKAKAEVTGLAAAEQQLSTVTAQNSIDALTGRQQALARVNQQYAEQAKTISATLANGAAQADVDRLLALNNEQLAVALGNTNAQFDRTEASSGAAGKALRAAEKDFNSFISTADKLAEALFPGEYAMREAQQLQAALDMYGSKLDDFQRRAVEAEIGNLFKASSLGLRSLSDDAKSAGRQAAEAIESTLGSVLSDLFSKPISDLDDFLDRVFSGFAQIGQANLGKVFDGLLTGGSLAANDNGFGLIGDAVKAGAKEGTQAGAAGGIFAALKGQGGAISAGLGGLGLGYQSANPLMGGLGGALQGFVAMGGNPLGAVIGGIAGVVGGLFGMNAELEKAKQKLNEARPALEKMMAAMDGEKISSYAAAFADYEKQVIEARALAWAAGDGDYARKLQDSFERLQGTMGRALNDEIERNILALSGMEYVNQAADALDQFNMRMKDAAFLLTDAPKAGEELTLTLQKIIDESKLTADQISDLAVRFPDLANALGMVKPYIDELVNGLSPERLFAMVEEANRAVESARSDLRTAYDAEARSLNEVIDRTRAYIGSLQQFRDGLRLDSNLSPLSQWERFQEVQRKFADVSQKALGGDANALADLENVSRDYLTEARAYYRNSETYFAIFKEVETLLDQALAVSDGQLTEAEKQLAALDKQVGLLIDLNSGVMSVAQAIANLTNVMALQRAANDNYNTGSGYSQDVLGLYRDVLGRAPDAEGAAYWQSKIAGGMTGSELYRQFIGTALGAGESPLTSAAMKWGVPGYADGTSFHPGGLAWVGERGPELLNLPRGAQVYPTGASMQMAAANGNGSADVVRELQQLRDELRQELAQLRAERRQGDQIASSNVEATRSVAKAVSDNGQAARLAAMRKAS